MIIDYQTVLWVGGGLVLLWMASVLKRQPRVTDRIWHWHLTIPGLNETPERFYAQVYQGLQEGIETRQVPLKDLGFGPITLFETRSILAERPVYFQARYQDLTLYLYVCQTANGLFISQWLFSKYTQWLNHPLMKFVAVWHLHRQTLFQFDSTILFGEAVHSVVLEVLDRYIAEEGLPPLEAYERRPLLQSFYGAIAPNAITGGSISASHLSHQLNQGRNREPQEKLPAQSKAEPIAETREGAVSREAGPAPAAAAMKVPKQQVTPSDLSPTEAAPMEAAPMEAAPTNVSSEPTPLTQILEGSKMELPQTGMAHPETPPSGISQTEAERVG